MKPIFSNRISRLTSSVVREILSLTANRDIISFAGGLPDTAAMKELPRPTVSGDYLQYGTTEGEPGLREWVANHLQDLGIDCSADRILITTGSQQGLDLVSKLFIDEGRGVLLESPSYLAALQSFRLFGPRFITLPISAEGIDPKELEEKIRKERPAFVYLIPTFQNPSGACYTEGVRDAVAEVVAEHGVPLVEDDPYREIQYEMVTARPIVSRFKKEPWVYLGTFSKTLMPGLRVGYMACSEDIYPYVVRLKQAADLHTNRPAQAFVAELVRTDCYVQHIGRLRRLYRRKRDTMEAVLRARWSDLASWDRPKGGLFYWLRLRQAVDTAELLKTAITQNVAYMPGEAFFPNEQPTEKNIRLNFSNPTEEEIQTGLEKLAEIFR